MRRERLKLRATGEQQGQLMLHRTRDLLMRQRTQVIKPFRVAAVALANKTGAPAREIAPAGVRCPGNGQLNLTGTMDEPAPTDVLQGRP
jgi:hypothetical protein